MSEGSLRNCRTAFTLPELLVAMVIMAILFCLTTLAACGVMKAAEGLQADCRRYDGRLEKALGDKKKMAFPTSGLLAWLRCDEVSGTRYDAIGNGQNFTEGGGTVDSGVGKIGLAAAMPDAPSGGAPLLGSIPAQSQWSSSIWIKFTTGVVDDGLILALSAATSSGLTTNTSCTELQLVDNSGNPVQSTSVAFTSTNWNHVVVTYNGTSARLYLNGVLSSTTTMPNSFQNSQAIMGPQTVGKFTYLDLVGFWNRALTLAEVTALYNSGNGLDLPPTPTASVAPAAGAHGTQRTFTDPNVATEGVVTAYDWDYGDGTAHGTANPQTHTYAADAVYTWILTTTDKDSQTGAYRGTVSVGKAPLGSRMMMGVGI